MAREDALSLNPHITKARGRRRRPSWPWASSARRRATPTRTASACAQSASRRRRPHRREAQGPGRARSQDPGGPLTSRQLNSRRRSNGPRPKAALAAAAHRVRYFIFQRGHRALRCPTRRSSGETHALQDRNRRPVTRPSTNGASCYAAVRGPAPQGAERPAEPVLWVGRARARARVGGRRDPKGAWLPASPRRSPNRRPWNDNSSQRSPRRSTARAGCSRRHFKPVLKKKVVDAGAPTASHHQTTASGRTVGRRARCTRGRPPPPRRRSRAPARTATRARRMRAARGRCRGAGSSAAEPPAGRVLARAAGAWHVRRGGRAAVENRRRVSTKWGPAARGAAACGGPAQPRRVVCRAFCARVICEKAYSEGAVVCCVEINQ